MDLHKESHTAVLVNCWNEILKTIKIVNKPSEFAKLTKAEAYPSYKLYFCNIDTKTALYFWQAYPSPEHLTGKTAEELYQEFRAVTPNVRLSKAELILECVRTDGNTRRDYQDSRDFITRSLVKDLAHQRLALAETEAEIEKMLATFDYQLTTLPGVGTAIAAKLISVIGDVNRFRSADKLAAFAGISPKNFSSACKGHDESNKQGNRELRSLFYFLAVSMVAVSAHTGNPYQPVFREYFLRKISEGKTKSQALVCIMRRLVNIVYGMMKNKTAYQPYSQKNIDF